MQVKGIAECRLLQGSILQYFRPSSSYQLFLRSLFCLFLSDGFTHALLYAIANSLPLVNLCFLIQVCESTCKHVVGDLQLHTVNLSGSTEIQLFKKNIT